jgi:hypothetical protein
MVCDDSPNCTEMLGATCSLTLDRRGAKTSGRH